MIELLRKDDLPNKGNCSSEKWCDKDGLYWEVFNDGSNLYLTYNPDFSSEMPCLIPVKEGEDIDLISYENVIKIIDPISLCRDNLLKIIISSATIDIYRILAKLINVRIGVDRTLGRIPVEKTLGLYLHKL